jgi:hypothetical protein
MGRVFVINSHAGFVFFAISAALTPQFTPQFFNPKKNGLK